jgi:4-aminobutyrate aminotransferase-like enzyme
LPGLKSQEIARRREKYVAESEVFSIENWDIIVDIIFLAKSLAAGLLPSVVIAKKRLPMNS